MTKTYAPVGKTPLLRCKLSRDHLSVIGAITPAGRLLFNIQEKAFNSGGIIAFLEHLKKYVPGKMLLIWDGAPIHRSRALKAYLSENEPGRFHLESLPAYAPEVNPQESVWRSLKHRELKNLCCKDLTHLRQELLCAIKRLRHRTKSILNCFAYAEGTLQAKSTLQT